MQQEHAPRLPKIVWGFGVIIALGWIGHEIRQHFEEKKLQARIKSTEEHIAPLKARISNYEVRISRLEEKLKLSRYVDYEKLNHLAGMSQQIDNLNREVNRALNPGDTELRERLMEMWPEVYEVGNRERQILDDIRRVKELRETRELLRKSEADLTRLQENLRVLRD